MLAALASNFFLVGGILLVENGPGFEEKKGPKPKHSGYLQQKN